MKMSGVRLWDVTMVTFVIVTLRGWHYCSIKLTKKSLAKQELLCYNVIKIDGKAPCCPKIPSHKTAEILRADAEGILCTKAKTS